MALFHIAVSIYKRNGSREAFHGYAVQSFASHNLLLLKLAHGDRSDTWETIVIWKNGLAAYIKGTDLVEEAHKALSEATVLDCLADV